MTCFMIENVSLLIFCAIAIIFYSIAPSIACSPYQQNDPGLEQNEESQEATIS